MSVYKQRTSAYWWIKIYDSHGKQIRTSSGTTDQALAESIEQTMKLAYAGQTPAAKLHAMIDAITGATTEATLLASVWTRYEKELTAANKKLDPTTLRIRRNECARFVKWTKDHYPAAQTAEEITRACAVAFANHLADSGLSGKSRKNIITDLGTIWESIRDERNEKLVNNWRTIKVDASDSKRGKSFTREQEKAVLEAAQTVGHGWYEASLIARHTGLRYSDIARLTREDVDVKEGVLKLNPRKTKRFNIQTIIPLNAIVRPVITQLLDTTTDYLFPDHAAAYPKYKTCPFSTVLEKAELPDGYTFHSWRHTFRTRLSEAGVSEEMAKRLGGWTEDATAARYDHAERITEMREAVEKAATENPTPSPAQ